MVFPNVSSFVNPPQAPRTPFMDLLSSTTEAEQNAPTSFGGDYFPDLRYVNAYLEEVVWIPAMGRWGVPSAAALIRVHVRKMSWALRNILNTWDEHDAALDFIKFTPASGEWMSAKYIEAVAHEVVATTIRVHLIGVQGPAASISLDYQPQAIEDMEFTFPQRLHFVGFLLEKSKRIANQVLLRETLYRYIVLPMTTLRSFARFRELEGMLTEEQKYHWLYVNPYKNTGCSHPTLEEQDQLRTISDAHWRQAKADRQRPSSLG